MMDVDIALRIRGSSRAIRPRPVARSAVEVALEQARFAPSGSNIQPCQAHVVGGAARDTICRVVGELMHWYGPGIDA